MWLIQVGPEPIHTVQEGRLYSFLPSVPKKIEDNFLARNILQELSITGITQVPESTDTSGMPQYDIEGAKKQAKQARLEGLRRIVDRYIKTQLEDRLRKNYPAMPPSEPEQKAIDELGIDLSEHGIRSFTSSPLSGDKSRSAADAGLIAKQNQRIDDLESGMRALMEQNKLLLAEIQGKKGKH
jgi:hypothetical protein